MKLIGATLIWGLLTIPAAVTLPGFSADIPTADVSLAHIVLDSSSPPDESAGPDPVSEIRLFFSGAPLMRGASVRVVTSARQLMRTSPPAADPTDPKQVFVQIDPPLPAGSYVVQWRCIADDGHVMRGDFTFEVTAE
jgi:methionine-rich copper-binding protein CopC